MSGLVALLLSVQLAVQFALTPVGVPQLFDQALNASRSGDFDQALPLWNQVVERAPDDAAAWSNPGSPRTARVHPYLIEPSSATLATYLIGFDETRNAMRTFRVDRIVNPRMTPSTFVRPKDVELERTLAAAWDIVADQPLEEIVIRFTPEAASRASETRWHPSQTSEREADGSLLWRARVSGLLEVRSWILGWGEGAEVLKPQALRDDVAQTLRAAALRYTGA